jgi:hypothetical protein
MFKMKININRHGPRLLSNTRQRLDPPYFSLTTTFKPFLEYSNALEECMADIKK